MSRTLEINLASYLYNKAKVQQRNSGTLQAAKNLRKQGIPLSLAVRILAGA